MNPFAQQDAALAARGGAMTNAIGDRSPGNALLVRSVGMNQALGNPTSPEELEQLKALVQRRAMLGGAQGRVDAQGAPDLFAAPPQQPSMTAAGVPGATPVEAPVALPPEFEAGLAGAGNFQDVPGWDQIPDAQRVAILRASGYGMGQRDPAAQRTAIAAIQQNAMREGG